MSIAVKTTEPIKIVKPPRSYPAWLVATFDDPNAPVPESELKKVRAKIEPGDLRVATPGKILFAHKNVPALYVPPPKTVQQLSKIPVKIKVLTATDRPIFGFGIRVNDTELTTNQNGETSIDVFKGHNVDFTTGRESGWSLPNGAKRKVRMTGMIAMSRIFPVNTPTTILLYPESGEYQIDGRLFLQPITYATS